MRAYYTKTLAAFRTEATMEIVGTLAHASGHDVQRTQLEAWVAQIEILKTALSGYDGWIALEYSIPRMGSRIDAVVIIEHAILVVEFKIGSSSFEKYAVDQVVDYALDLHYFHEPSHDRLLAPVLVATNAPDDVVILGNRYGCLLPVYGVNSINLSAAIEKVLEIPGEGVDAEAWMNGRYSPTPTIVEAATALYRGHAVEDISRSDAAGESLRATSDAISSVIENSSRDGRKSICFVTGVPGAGKTLVGLNIANKHKNKADKLYSVYLSGNGPLVKILVEALARDKVAQAKSRGEKLAKKKVYPSIKQFIQNVHNFRDDCLARPDVPPIEHVALFDEAQRAWNLEQTIKFMTRKKNRPDFNQSEPDFLISCLDRHDDWATIVCLVGGGQEINTGEGGISEWMEALRGYASWDIHVAPELLGSEFSPGELMADFEADGRVTKNPLLHLSASMRAFRAERVSELAAALLDFDIVGARGSYRACSGTYPIAITRNIDSARTWLRDNARGTERIGIIASSAAQRLRPLAIHVKAPMDPVNWFLNDKDDIRSSHFLEDVATEFDVQGLELDWTCVTWDADFRRVGNRWQNWDFVGSKWQRISKDHRKRYQKNAYRVLLTRARQGMVICIPKGDRDDQTRHPDFYDPTFDYLKSIGFPVI